MFMRWLHILWSNLIKFLVSDGFPSASGKPCLNFNYLREVSKLKARAGQ